MNQPTQSPTYAKYKEAHSHLHGAFGNDEFGHRAERIARFLGTPRYILAQTLLVMVWIAFNGVAISLGWDPYPFILLNLAFSTQAAYAAPLILLAQTRQAERDRAHEEAAACHRDELTGSQHKLLEENTLLTKEIVNLSREIDSLTRSIHGEVCIPGER